jgi:hypothetical protein
MGVVVGVMSDSGAAVVRKWLVAPESRITHCLIVSALASIVLRRAAAASAYFRVGYE